MLVALLVWAGSARAAEAPPAPRAEPPPSIDPTPGRAVAVLPDTDILGFEPDEAVARLPDQKPATMPRVSVPVADVVAYVRQHGRTAWFGLYEGRKKTFSAWYQTAIVTENGRELVMLANGGSTTATRYFFETSSGGALVRVEDVEINSHFKSQTLVERLPDGRYQRRVIFNGRSRLVPDEAELRGYPGRKDVKLVVELNLTNGALAFLTLLAQGKLRPGAWLAYQTYSTRQNHSELMGGRLEASRTRGSGVQHRLKMRLWYDGPKIFDSEGNPIRVNNDGGGFCLVREPERQARDLKDVRHLQAIFAAYDWLDELRLSTGTWFLSSNWDRVVLDLKSTPVTDDELKHLRFLSRVEVLDLTDTKITDRALEQLAALPRLRTLKLTGTQVELARVEPLVRLRMLRSLWLDGTGVTEAGVARLARMTQLTELHLPERLPLSSLAELRQRLPGCVLHQSGTRVALGVSREQLLRLPALARALAGWGMAYRPVQLLGLEGLDLDGKPVRDGLLAQLSGLPLERLELRETAITDAGLAHLAALPSLRELYLSGTDVTDAGISALAPLRSRLRVIELGETLITDRVITLLLRFTGLKRLVVPAQISKASLDQIRRAIPGCTVEQSTAGKRFVPWSESSSWRKALHAADWQGCLAVILSVALLVFLGLGVLALVSPEGRLPERVTRFVLDRSAAQVLAGLGLALLVTSAGRFYQAARFEAGAHQAQGTVIRVVGGRGERFSSPVVRFRDRAGGQVTFQAHEHGSAAPLAQLGRRLTVLYDPQRPGRARLAGDTSVWNRHASGLFAVCLGALLILGAAAFALRVRSRRRREA